MAHTMTNERGTGLKSLLALLSLCFTAAAVAAEPTLEVRDAWLRKVPGSDVAAVYFTLHNAGSAPVVLVGARSTVAEHAMIHETAMENGHSRMRMRERTAIVPGQTLKFEPGGLHVMLHGFAGEPAVGSEVDVTLLLEDGSEVHVAARVRPLGAQ